MKIGFVSLGCPKNLVDSEVMLGLAEQAGHEITSDAGSADVLVVNTCAFIDRAKQESVDTILEMAELKKQAKPVSGTAIAQATAGTGGDDFFTFMGYDKRTALGAGAIQTVAGGISFRNTLSGGGPYVSMHRIRMNLGAPIPSLSPAGFAAAGALMLLAVGYAVRRRLR